MKLVLKILVIITWAWVTGMALAETMYIPERKMNVQQGPDAVFDEDVGEILPDLKGASATMENGRVGNELVFWGYRLADGEQGYFYACAPLEDVDCEGRVQAICPVETRVVARTERSGLISRLQCEAICGGTPGGILPCCKELMENNTLMVGLVQCP